MSKWLFPSRGYAETEGYSNAGLAEFKGNPLQALAREVCQNSLDAADGSENPVQIEFCKEFVEIDKFPGMQDMRRVIQACKDFWWDEGDINTKNFITKARRSLEDSKFFVLRISDYNTKGVQGAFSDKNITPWGGLVKGNSFSVKSDEKNAQGSYGIGKAAPFVSSAIQTIFYRTFDVDNVRATLGVSRLMAHRISDDECATGEDPVRRSVGYFGETDNNKPSIAIEELDDIYYREEHGTDLFIPAFEYSTASDEWIRNILIEIVDNFLYAIYSGKLEVNVEGKKLTRSTLPQILEYLGNKAKNASMYYEVIREDNEKVIEETEDYYGLGKLRLRLLYKPDMNKNVLVVRNSGMKIATIPSLPKGMSYVGFFELQGDKLNQIFRCMENPKHSAWEPKRHQDPNLAKKYKDEVEKWVRDVINKKIVEESKDETVIDLGECFNYSENSSDEIDNESNKKEVLVDNVKSFVLDEKEEKKSRDFEVTDQGGNNNNPNSKTEPGTEDVDGEGVGHRHRSGKKGGTKRGRKATANPDGIDKVHIGTHSVGVSARIISRGEGTNRLIFYTKQDISLGELEIVTKGENGKTLRINVKEARGQSIETKDGHIVIKDIKAGEKNVVDFKIAGNKNYAMGVRAYGN